MNVNVTMTAVAAFAAVALTGCAAADTSAEARPAKAAKAAESKAPEVDILTKAACRHFRNVVGDIDVLTTEELRKKLKEVHDSGQYAEAPGIQAASRGMLAAATADDAEAFMVSVGDMAGACTTAGA